MWGFFLTRCSTFFICRTFPLLHFCWIFVFKLPQFLKQQHGSCIRNVLGQCSTLAPAGHCTTVTREPCTGTDVLIMMIQRMIAVDFSPTMSVRLFHDISQSSLLFIAGVLQRECHPKSKIKNIMFHLLPRIIKNLPGNLFISAICTTD